MRIGWWDKLCELQQRHLRGCLKSPHRCKDYEGRVQTSRVIDPIAFSLMLDRLVKSRLFKHPLTQASIAAKPSEAALYNPGEACDLERTLPTFDDL